VTDADVVEVSVHVEAQPETVFPYFTDPERYVQWMGARATLEPVPGGSYCVRMKDGVEVCGEFVEIDPPRRLVFTWGWLGDPAVAPGSTRVVVTLEPEGGGTRVILRHHGLPDGDTRAHHRAGWEAYAGRLAVRVGGGDPGPDPNAS
jgi:uncharacterized protein YndB with AHSA1/START domain